MMDRDANIQNRWEQSGGFRNDQYNAHIQNHYHSSSSKCSISIRLLAVLITLYRKYRDYHNTHLYGAILERSKLHREIRVSSA
jgi:hypothetical protein